MNPLGRSGLIDSFGRRLNYLRLSVTDRCNLRCVYCLPDAGYRFKDSRELLTDGEIVQLLSLFSQMGISKVRVTGGEPLLRPGIVELVERLRNIEGIEEVTLSTNGVLFSKMCGDLRKAGICRINISLDTLNADKFKRITRFGDIEDVFLGLRQALAYGYDPVKINVVIMRGTNDDEIPDFVRLTKEFPVHVRFIELMPIGETGFFSPSTWMPLDQIKAKCGMLEPAIASQEPRGWGPAVYWKVPESLGTIGFISALSCNFCSRCNRLRLTALGKLHACLASAEGVYLGRALRNGLSGEEICRLILQGVRMKPERHHMETSAVKEAFMCSLGG